MSHPDRIDDAIAAIIAAALPGGTPPSHPPDDPAALIDRARAQRVTGLVLAGLDAGAPSWPPEALLALEEAHVECLRSSLAAESVAVAVAETLSRAGIGYAITKGCATCHLDYPDPARDASPATSTS